jgi:4-carboxymuconolactone decarboxylase
MPDEPPPSPLTAAGRATRRRVLGAAHVERAEGRATGFDAPFQALVTDTAWGHVWSRAAIPPRERSMLTIAILAALGCEEELALHLRATAATGASEADVREALLHVAVYAGVPRANTAFRIARETFAAMRGEDG